MIGVRITNQMLLNQVITNLQLNDQALQTAETQVSTGKAINVPSDNPFGASQIVNFHQAIGLNTQLQTNLTSATGWLDASDSALNSMEDDLQRARELAIQGSNDTYTATDRQNIAVEIHQLLLNTVDAANSKFGNEFLFAGTKTTQQPFFHDGSTQSPNLSAGAASPVNYFGDSGTVTRQIDQAAQIGVNVAGSSLTGIFSTLSQLEYDLNNSATRVSGSRSGINAQTDKIGGFPGTAETFSINGVKIGTAVPATIGGQPQTITGFAPNTPISQVVNQINSQTNQTGVQASIDQNGVLVLQLVQGSPNKQIILSEVDTVATDVNGNDLTNGTGVPVSTGGDAGHDLGLSDAMQNTIGSVDVTAIDNEITKLDALRANVGAKTNRVSEGTTRLSGLQITLQQLNANYEDVDMAKAVSNLATQQTTFQAALGAAAKVLPPTLLDFLK